MDPGGLAGDEQALRDLTVRAATGDEPQDLDLTLGQAGLPKSRGPASRLRGGRIGMKPSTPGTGTPTAMVAIDTLDGP